MSDDTASLFAQLLIATPQVTTVFRLYNCVVLPSTSDDMQTHKQQQYLCHHSTDKKRSCVITTTMIDHTLLYIVFTDNFKPLNQT